MMLTAWEIESAFPGWKVTPLPGLSGRWEAYWQSGDGLLRHVITGPQPQLVERLRAIREEES